MRKMFGDYLNKKFFFLITIALLSFLSSHLSAQSTQDQLDELKQRPGYNITHIDENWVRIDYPGGKSIVKNISGVNRQGSDNTNRSADTTIINLLNADSTAYYHKYKLWREAPIHNWELDHIEVGDVDKDGNPELYGTRKTYTSDYEPVTIYEFDEVDELIFKHQYDTAQIVDGIYDIDKDNRDEVLLGVAGNVFPRQHWNFTATDDTSLATNRDFTFIPFTASTQASDVTMLDFDQDEFTDLIIAQSLQPKVYVFEYDPSVNNFVQRFVFDTGEEPQYFTRGFSIGDFDQDGYKEIGFGTGQAHIYLIENQGNDLYEGIWQDTIGTGAAYFHNSARDIDKNSKPEYIVMSDYYYNSIPSLIIAIYETVGNNNYEQVGIIILVGGGTWSAGTLQAVDVDNDGRDEIAVCIDNKFLLLKFTGSENYHQYEIDFLKLNEAGALPNESSSYFGALVADLFQDNNWHILISMNHIINDGGNYTSKRMTRVYQPTFKTTNIKEISESSIDFVLEQNYPNPFNPITKIKFTMPTPPVSSPLLKGRKQVGFVSLKIYDVLGNEVATLVNEYKPAGSYEVEFNAEGLPSGIYFYRLSAGSYLETRKMILLK